MEFVYDAFGQRSFIGNAVHHETDGGFLISQDVNEQRRLNIGAGPGNEILGEPLKNQGFGGSAIEVVEALQDPSLNTERTNESIGEALQAVGASLLETIFDRPP